MVWGTVKFTSYSDPSVRISSTSEAGRVSRWALILALGVSTLACLVYGNHWLKRKPDQLGLDDKQLGLPNLSLLDQ